MIIKTFRNKRKIICYITQDSERFTVSTGKPSDMECLSWKYDNLVEAEATAHEFFERMTSPLL